MYGTYLGGSGFDSANAVAVDTAGLAYMVGETRSNGSFPVVNVAGNAFGGGTSDAFVVKLNLSKTGTASVSYSRYLGGSGNDIAEGIDVNATKPRIELREDSLRYEPLVT